METRTSKSNLASQGITTSPIIVCKDHKASIGTEQQEGANAQGIPPQGTVRKGILLQLMCLQ